jgi:arabinan endo-1,5-alpha-L-arabinosidase
MHKTLDSMAFALVLFACAESPRNSLPSEGPGVCGQAGLACAAGGAGAADLEASGIEPPGTAGSTGAGEEVVTPVGLVVPDAAVSSENTGEPAATDAGSLADAGSAALDRCDVGVLDPNDPPQALTLSGNLGAHDPVIIAAEGQYHYFSTGNGISVKTSPDLLRWTQQPDIFPSTPAWFQQLVPDYEPRNIWAPDISYFGGQYHLYYSVSSFGSNRSCIGHATRATLSEGNWTDQEAVFCSNQPGANEDYNAIDPNVVLDESGTPWMSFGSFWDGLKMIRLAPSGDRAGTDLYDLASRGGGAIEAPFIVRRCGYYYLFVSFDACCRGADSTYSTRVGRSPEVLGPYVAKDGTPMLNGGGSPVLAAGGDWVGPGHNAILIDGTRAYNVYHAYAATNGASQLRISELVWDAEGWPVSGGP